MAAENGVETTTIVVGTELLPSAQVKKYKTIKKDTIFKKTFAKPIPFLRKI